MSSVTVGTREDRGKAIASQGDQIKKVNDNQFKVKSQSGHGYYDVKKEVILSQLMRQSRGSLERVLNQRIG